MARRTLGKWGHPAGPGLSVLLVILGVSTAARASAQNLVSNGSFEQGLVGWTVSGNVEHSTTEGSTDGVRSAIFNGGDRVPNGVILQRVPVDRGCSYQLECDFGAFSAVFTTAQSLAVKVTGTTVAVSDTIPDSGSNPTTFVHRNYTFQADADSIEVRFTDVSTATISVDGVLDHVVLTRVASPVPALSGVWLLALAGALLGAALLHRAMRT